jgi:hypothetical protein
MEILAIVIDGGVGHAMAGKFDARAQPLGADVAKACLKALPGANLANMYIITGFVAMHRLMNVNLWQMMLNNISA